MRPSAMRMAAPNRRVTGAQQNACAEPMRRKSAEHESAALQMRSAAIFYGAYDDAALFFARSRRSHACAPIAMSW